MTQPQPHRRGNFPTPAAGRSLLHLKQHGGLPDALAGMRRALHRHSLVMAGLACLLLAAPSFAANIVHVRVGDHPTFTRVVFELDAPAGYRIEKGVDRGTQELIVTLEAASSPHSVRSGSPEVGLVAVQQGTRLTLAHIRLRNANAGVKELILNDPPRIVIDLMREPSRIAAAKAAAAKPAVAKTAKPAVAKTAEPAVAKKPEATAPEAKAAESKTAAPKPAEAVVAPKPVVEPKPQVVAVKPPPEPSVAPKPVVKAAVAPEVTKPEAKPAPLPVTPKLETKSSPPAVAPKLEVKPPPPPVAPKIEAKVTPPSVAPVPAVKPVEPIVAPKPETKLAAPPVAPQPEVKPVPVMPPRREEAVSPPPAPPEIAKVTPAEIPVPAPAAKPPMPGLEPEAVAKPPMPGLEPEAPAAPSMPEPKAVAKPLAPAPVAKPHAPEPAAPATWFGFEPMQLAALGGGVLLLVFLVVMLMRRRRLPNDLDVTALVDEDEEPPTSISEGLDFGAGEREVAPAHPRSAPERMAPAHTSPIAAPGDLFGDTDQELFDSTEKGEKKMSQDTLDLPVSRSQRPNPAPTMATSASSAGDSDVTRLVRELERRVAQIETRLDEANDARERLERQVAAQSEELRVQRAAIARTQRALRGLNRGEEEQATEPALRDPSRPAGGN